MEEKLVMSSILFALMILILLGVKYLGTNIKFSFHFPDAKHIDNRQSFSSIIIDVKRDDTTNIHTINQSNQYYSSSEVNRNLLLNPGTCDAGSGHAAVMSNGRSNLVRSSNYHTYESLSLHNGKISIVKAHSHSISNTSMWEFEGMENYLVSPLNIRRSCELDGAFNYIHTHLSPDKSLYTYLDKREIRLFFNCLQPGVVICVQTDWVDRFFIHTYPLIKVPFVLVSSGHVDSGVSFKLPDNVKADNKIIHWYAVNCLDNSPDPKMYSCVPMGILESNMFRSLVTFSKSLVLTKVYQPDQYIAPHKNSSFNVLIAFDVKTNLRIRVGIFVLFCCENGCDPNTHLYTNRFKVRSLCLSSRVSEKEFHTILGSSKFIVSPHGNGVDCYRTWESLYLGAWPIVLSSSLDSLYEGLPVLIVNNWEDVTPELLEKTERKFLNTVFNYEKLLSTYWERKFHSHGYDRFRYSEIGDANILDLENTTRGSAATTGASVETLGTSHAVDSESESAGMEDAMKARDNIKYAAEYKTVRLLLRRLDAFRNEEHAKRFPTSSSLRFSEAAFSEQFSYLHSPSLVFQNRSGPFCRTFHMIPSIPHLSSPLDESTLTWTEDMKKIFSMENKQYFSDREVLADYKTSPYCNYALRKQNTNNRVDSDHSPIDHDQTQSVPMNYILTMAEGGMYDCHKLSIFLKSLRDTGSHAQVVIFSNTHESSSCAHISDSCGGVIVEPVLGFEGIHMELRRYVLALKYLNKNMKSMLNSNILFCDFQDVYFQRDPFATFLDKIDTDVVITEEGYDTNGKQITIVQEPSNANVEWLTSIITQIHGDNTKLFDRISQMPVLNSGQILGSFRGLYNTLHVMCFVADMIDASAYKSATGQGILLYSYYTGLLSRATRVTILTPAASIGVNAIYYHPNLRNPDKPYDIYTNPMVNQLHAPYAIIHMYKVWHIMSFLEDFVLQFGKLNWKFQPVSSPDECNLNKTYKIETDYF